MTSTPGRLVREPALGGIEAISAAGGETPKITVSTPLRLLPALADFGFWGEEFYGPGKLDRTDARLDAGTPVLVWLGLWGDTGFYEYATDGTPYKLVPGLHVVVADGYDSGGVYAADPATGGMKYDWSTFMSFWNVMDGMGLSVSPL